MKWSPRCIGWFENVYIWFDTHKALPFYKFPHVFCTCLNHSIHVHLARARLRGRGEKGWRRLQRPWVKFISAFGRRRGNQSFLQSIAGGKKLHLLIKRWQLWKEEKEKKKVKGQVTDRANRIPTGSYGYSSATLLMICGRAHNHCGGSHSTISSMSSYEN